MKKIISSAFLALIIASPVFAANVQNNNAPISNCSQAEQFFLFDNVARDFSHYINYRDGLIRQAQYESKASPADKAELLIYKKDYVKERNFYRGELQGRLMEANYYFNANTQKLIGDFIAWDNQHISDSIDTKSLPTTAQYVAWQNKIVSSMAQQLNNKVSS